MGKTFVLFDYYLLTRSVRKMVLICLMQSINMCLLYKSHQIARLVSHFINHFSKWMFTATKFGSKNRILHIFLYHKVTSYDYIIVDSCIISFNLNCIIQLKQFYNIATKVSSRKKSATTFGDLPDCAVVFCKIVGYTAIELVNKIGLFAATRAVTIYD